MGIHQVTRPADETAHPVARASMCKGSGDNWAVKIPGSEPLQQKGVRKQEISRAVGKPYE